MINSKKDENVLDITCCIVNNELNSFGIMYTIKGQPSENLIIM